MPLDKGAVHSKQHASIAAAENLVDQCSRLVSLAQNDSGLGTLTEKAIKAKIDELAKKLSDPSRTEYVQQRTEFSMTPENGNILTGEQLMSMGVDVIEQLQKKAEMMPSVLQLVSAYRRVGRPRRPPLGSGLAL